MNTARVRRIRYLYYKKGYTQKLIGKILGVSTQRIHQLLHGYKSFASHSFSNSKHPISTLSNLCIRCNEKSTLIHHADGNSKNNKPQNLIPLCIICHGIFHKVLNKKKLTKRSNNLNLSLWQFPPTPFIKKIMNTLSTP